MAKTLPILMNGQMVRAILDDLKNMTRRCVPEKIASCIDITDGQPYVEDENGEFIHVRDLAPCQPGDILYVRETWAIDREKSRILWNGEPHEPEVIRYRADGSELLDSVWKPSVHMPKWACRLFLRVTNVRVERLQGIGLHDCLAEGVGEIPSHGSHFQNGSYLEGSFRVLWDSLSKPGFKWSDNPWVWVYEFEKCEKPEGWPNA